MPVSSNITGSSKLKRRKSTATSTKAEARGWYSTSSFPGS